MDIQVTMPDGRETAMFLRVTDTIQDIMNMLEINDQTIIIKKNGALAHPDETMMPNDHLQFVGIIFGG